VAVLSSLGSADISHFARATVDNDVATFADKTRLHGKGGGGTGIGGAHGEVLILLGNVLFDPDTSPKLLLKLYDEFWSTTLLNA